MQYVFSDQDFSKPYFLTYLSASSFSLYLFGFLFKKEWRDGLRELRWRERGGHAAANLEQEESLLPARGAEAEAEAESTAPQKKLTFHETVAVCLKFFILWFIANYIYKYVIVGAFLLSCPPCSALPSTSVLPSLRLCLTLWISLSLDATSVSSNTILSATSSFFTLAFGAIFPGTPADLFSVSKLVCSMALRG